MADLSPQRALGLLGNGGITLTTERQRAVAIRQSSAADTELIWDMHHQLSERTIRLRYGAPKQLYPAAFLREQVERMMADDAGQSAALIATVADGNHDTAVALVQLVHDPAEPGVAEIAILVRDDYQREGLGRALTRLMQLVARARGVRELCINALAENRAVMRLVRGFGMPYTASASRGEITIVIPLGAGAE
ncbi:MAG TPA: GNAT family N-acetyltransferase [Roseiflexaceae bacterium]|nr:GNAT family N-acetyltransferase [Roseiflexaceae bacterium]